MACLFGLVTSMTEKSTEKCGRPLFGLRVLVTRPRHQAADLCRKLTEIGAGCLVQPAITIEPPPDWQPVDEALARLDQFDWLVFSSANGVRFLLDRLHALHGDLRRLAAVKLAAIGPQTAAELAGCHLSADLQPGEFRAEALAAALAEGAAGRRFLLARASRGRDLLAERLAEAGGVVEQIVVYTSRDVELPDEEVIESLQDDRIDWITVTSSAIARSLVTMFGDRLRRARLASISPVTSETLREFGYEPAVEAAQYTTDGLVEAICAAGAQ